MKNIVSSFVKFCSKKDTKNILYTFITYIINPLLTILSTPVMLKSLGAKEFGVWIVINSLVSFIGITNLGLGNSIVKLGAAYISSNNTKHFNKIFNFNLALTIVVGLITTISLLVCGEYIAHLFVKQDSTVYINTSFQLVGVIVFVKILGVLIASVLMAYERYDYFNKINILINIILIVFSVVLVKLGFKILSLTILLFISSLLNVIINYYFCKKIFPDLLINPRFYKEVKKEVLSYSLYSWIQVINKNFSTQFDKLLIGSLLGPTFLSYYSLCMQLAIKIHELPSSLAAILFPKFSGINEKGDHLEIRRLYLKSSKLILISICTLAIPLYLYSYDILFIWIDIDTANKYSEFMEILVLMVSFTSIGIVSYYYLNATDYIKINTLLSVIGSIKYLIFLYLFVYIFNFHGAAYSRIAFVIISITTLIYVDLKIHKVEKKNILLNLTSLLLLFIISYLIKTNIAIQINNVLELVLYVFILCTVVVMMLSFMLFRTDFLSAITRINNKKQLRD